jgi:hypothetical protein
MSPSPKSAPDLVWVYITGAAFVLAIVLAGLFIAFADRLTFVSNAVYYILLMPIALAAAAFLFGAMRSHARYKGQASLGTLQLSGPVVVFALVLLGGLLLANPAATSSLTVRLYGSADRADLVTDGEVVLDLGDDRRTRAVGPDGQVTFAQVPVQFLSRTRCRRRASSSWSWSASRTRRRCAARSSMNRAPSRMRSSTSCMVP